MSETREEILRAKKDEEEKSMLEDLSIFELIDLLDNELYDQHKKLIIDDIMNFELHKTKKGDLLL